MTPPSIKRNLLAWLLIPLLTLLGVISLNAYYRSIRISETVYDRALYDTVLTLGILVHAHAGHVTVDLPPIARRMLEVDPMDSIYYAVKTLDGRTLQGDATLPLGPVLYARDEVPVFFDGQHQGIAIRISAARIYAEGDSTQPVIVEVAETLKKRQVMARQILQQSIAPVLFFLLLAILVVWLAVHRALRPLLRLSETVNQRSSLDFHPLPTDTVPDEVRPLTSAFNTLIQRFEASYTSQKRLVSNAAHQLRTPVAGMRVLIEAELLDCPVEQQPPILQRLHQSVLRMSRLVTQLLSLSRAEPGLPIDMTTLDLSALLHQVIDAYTPLATTRHTTLQVTLVDDLKIKGHAVMLTEMLGNLIDNALRYSPHNSQVKIRTMQRGSSIVIHIEDAGSGINASDVDRIFERFYRGQHVSSEGTGLGLAIVKEIADAHGARVSLASCLHTSGTLVEVEIPRA